MSDFESLVLFVDPPASGPVNMGRDEALLDAVGKGIQPPTLRLYAWERPTISLGYFQPIAEIHAQPAAIGALPVVRRTTGGGAILHDREVTYTLVVPIEHPWLKPNANQLYERAHTAVVRAVGGPARMFGDGGPPGGCSEGHRSGPFFCFARRHAFDVVVPSPHEPSGFAKLAGSAQRRTRRAVLQHGSIILDSRFPEQSCAAWSALGGPAEFVAAVSRLIPAFAATLHADLVRRQWPGSLSPEIDVLTQKYAGELWTLGCDPIRPSGGAGRRAGTSACREA